MLVSWYKGAVRAKTVAWVNPHVLCLRRWILFSCWIDRITAFRRILLIWRDINRILLKKLLPLRINIALPPIIFEKGVLQELVSGLGMRSCCCCCCWKMCLFCCKRFPFGMGWHSMEMNEFGSTLRVTGISCLCYTRGTLLFSPPPTEGLNVDLVPHPASHFVGVYLVCLFLAGRFFKALLGNEISYTILLGVRNKYN